MSDIFVSYASEDREKIMPLVHALEETGWSIFWDRTIPPGKSWREVIGSEIQSARCVVVVWTEVSVGSRWVQEEAEVGSRKGILVPVALEDIEPPFGFGSIQSANLAAWDGDPSSRLFTQLHAAISMVLGSSPAEQTQEDGRLREEVAHLREKKQRRAEKEARRQAEEEKAVKEAVKQQHRTKSEPMERHPGDVFRDRLKDGSKGPETVVIPAGEFQMGDSQGSGSDSEQPVHRVHIAKPFAMGKYPVTFEQYDLFAKATGRKLPEDNGWGRENRPVINVSWEDAVGYTEWLSRQTGKPYRLPTEAEWEYAARAGTKTDYWWGNEWKSNMEHNEGKSDSLLRSVLFEWGRTPTAAVGSFPANPFGLHDMLGNVSEYVQDCWHSNYKYAPTDGSAWLGGECGTRVTRGNPWSPSEARAARRGSTVPDDRVFCHGFRLVQDLEYLKD